MAPRKKPKAEPEAQKAQPEKESSPSQEDDANTAEDSTRKVPARRRGQEPMNREPSEPESKQRRQVRRKAGTGTTSAQADAALFDAPPQPTGTKPKPARDTGDSDAIMEAVVKVIHASMQKHACLQGLITACVVAFTACHFMSNSHAFVLHFAQM